MGERERVRRAIAGPVEEAARLLDATPNADVQTRLTILIDGWGRGLAAGLEELALAAGDLRSSPEGTSGLRDDESDSQPALQELSEADEGQLRERAERLREATAALRSEASSDDGEPPSETGETPAA